jgi:hypothetical protein
MVFGLQAQIEAGAELLRSALLGGHKVLTCGKWWKRSRQLPSGERVRLPFRFGSPALPRHWPRGGQHSAYRDGQRLLLSGSICPPDSGVWAAGRCACRNHDQRQVAQRGARPRASEKLWPPVDRPVRPRRRHLPRPRNGRNPGPSSSHGTNPGGA